MRAGSDSSVTSMGSQCHLWSGLLGKTVQALAGQLQELRQPQDSSEPPSQPGHWALALWDARLLVPAGPGAVPAEGARFQNVGHLSSSRCFLPLTLEGRAESPKMGDNPTNQRQRGHFSEMLGVGGGRLLGRGGRSPTPSPHQGTPSAPFPLRPPLGEWVDLGAAWTNCTSLSRAE